MFHSLFLSCCIFDFTRKYFCKRSCFSLPCYVCFFLSIFTSFLKSTCKPSLLCPGDPEATYPPTPTSSPPSPGVRAWWRCTPRHSIYQSIITWVIRASSPRPMAAKVSPSAPRRRPSVASPHFKVADHVTDF